MTEGVLSAGTVKGTGFTTSTPGDFLLLDLSSLLELKAPESKSIALPKNEDVKFGSFEAKISTLVGFSTRFGAPRFGAISVDHLSAVFGCGASGETGRVARGATPVCILLDRLCTGGLSLGELPRPLLEVPPTGAALGSTLNGTVGFVGLSGTLATRPSCCSCVSMSFTSESFCRALLTTTLPDLAEARFASLSWIFSFSSAATPYCGWSSPSSRMRSRCSRIYKQRRGKRVRYGKGTVST